MVLPLWPIMLARHMVSKSTLNNTMQTQCSEVFQAAVVAAYIWYLKRSGYLGDIEDPDEEITREDSYRARFKTQEDKAAQLCDRYSKL